MRVLRHPPEQTSTPASTRATLPSPKRYLGRSIGKTSSFRDPERRSVGMIQPRNVKSLWIVLFPISSGIFGARILISKCDRSRRPMVVGSNPGGCTLASKDLRREPDPSKPAVHSPCYHFFDRSRQPTGSGCFCAAATTFSVRSRDPARRRPAGSQCPRRSRSDGQRHRWFVA